MYAIYQGNLYRSSSLFRFCNDIVDSSERYNPEKHSSKDAFVNWVMDARDASGDSIYNFYNKKDVLTFIHQEMCNAIDDDDEKSLSVCVSLLGQFAETAF